MTIIKADSATMPASYPPAPLGFNLVLALTGTGDDPDLLRELIVLFQGEYPTLLQALRDAVASCNASAVERAAHSLKGIVATFGASECRASALRLETSARAGQLADLRPELEAFEKSVASLNVELSAYIA